MQNEKIEDKRGSYCVKVHYKYDFVEDFQDLYEDQGPKITDDGSSTEQDSANTSRGMCTIVLYSYSLTFKHNTYHTNSVVFWSIASPIDGI